MQTHTGAQDIIDFQECLFLATIRKAWGKKYIYNKITNQMNIKHYYFSLCAVQDLSQFKWRKCIGQ